jgi:hypothetical protein
MIRAAANAVYNAYETFWRPTQKPDPPRVAMVAPNFIASAQFNPPRTQRIYEYRMKHAADIMMFMGVATGDLMGYPYTHAELGRALETYYKTHGPITTHTVVLDAQDWIGRFVIDENTNDQVLVLRLVEGADVRICKDEGYPPHMTMS